MRIILVGFMGVGKSTIGKCLSEHLNYQFIDLDELIEEKQGKTINEIFFEKGERAFRTMEFNALKEALKIKKVIISSGGGTLCNEKALKFAKSRSIIIHLKRFRNQLFQILKENKSSRPLIKDKTNEALRVFIDRLYKKRRFYYNQANIVIYNNNTPDNVTSRIIKKLSN